MHFAVLRILTSVVVQMGIGGVSGSCCWILAELLLQQLGYSMLWNIGGCDDSKSLQCK